VQGNVPLAEPVTPLALPQRLVADRPHDHSALPGWGRETGPVHSRGRFSNDAAGYRE
jgi:hypothetical protein